MLSGIFGAVVEACLCGCMYPCREVVELFRRDELLDWSEFEATFGPVLRDGVEDVPATTVFQRGDALGERQWEDFRKRVIEHVRFIFDPLHVCIPLSVLNNTMVASNTKSKTSPVRYKELWALWLQITRAYTFCSRNYFCI